MNPEGVPLPQQPASEDPVALKAEVSRLTRQILAERQSSGQTITAERAKWKAEMDKLRQSTYQHGRDLENQNQALLQSLGRMKAENDELQKRIYQLEARVTQDNGRSVAEAVPTLPVLGPTPPVLQGGAIPTPKQS
jgi:cell division protein FtsB